MISETISKGECGTRGQSRRFTELDREFQPTGRTLSLKVPVVHLSTFPEDMRSPFVKCKYSGHIHTIYIRLPRILTCVEREFYFAGITTRADTSTTGGAGTSTTGGAGTSTTGGTDTSTTGGVGMSTTGRAGMSTTGRTLPGETWEPARRLPGEPWEPARRLPEELWEPACTPTTGGADTGAAGIGGGDDGKSAIKHKLSCATGGSKNVKRRKTADGLYDTLHPGCRAERSRAKK